jgi:tetratricopeptide (TPR) repeat protein
MEVAQAHGNKQQTGMCLDRLGIIALRSYEFQDAYDLFSRALILARETTDLQQIARLLTNLGDTAHCLEDFEGFASFSEEAVRIAREIGDKRMLAMSLHNYSDALLCNARLEQAQHRCIESIALAKEFDLPVILIHDYALLGRVQHLQGSFEAAESTLQSALPLAQSLTHERHAETRCLFGLGELYFEQGRYAPATDAFKRLGEVANGRQPDMLGQSLFGLARLAYVEGKMAQAAQLAGQSLSTLGSDKPKLAAQVRQWAQEHLSIRLDQTQD